MKLISEKRCIIGEGPFWNEREQRLYYTNGFGNEICMLDFCSGKLDVRKMEVGVSAFAFDKNNRLIVSRKDGVFILKDDDTTEELYDTSKICISHANDMKVGPDGRIYVGTQSGKRLNLSDKTDGKLFSIDKEGNVRVLLDDLILSNGLEWSLDEKKFYHTDSDTNIIKEFDFDSITGNINFTGRSVRVLGVDGFTIDNDGNLLVACWGQGHIAVVDTKELKVVSYIEMPVRIPASCAFAGKNMDVLAVTTASYGADIEKDKNAGFTILKQMRCGGRKPYVFGLR